MFKKRLKQFESLKLKKSSKEKISDLIDEIQLHWGRYISYTHFGAFLNACQTNRDSAGKKKNKNLLIEVLEKYIELRDVNADFSLSVIQGYIDKGASRKQGSTGKKKMEAILLKNGYCKSDDWSTFLSDKKVYGVCTTGVFSAFNIRKNLKIDLQTASNNQGKQLDFIIKKGHQFYLVEQKNLNVSGGGQDQKIKELIDFIKYKEQNMNVSYVSFLDGKYFNNVLLSGGPKHIEQIKQIKTNLKNTNNFWLNTKGFKELLKLN